MAANKTQPTDASVDDFLAAIGDDTRREECRTVRDLMREVTGTEPVVWGVGVVGFGRFRYKAGARGEAEWFVVGFSPRKTNLTLDLLAGLDAVSDLLPRFGKHATGKGCLYLKKLAGVDLGVLKEIAARAATKFAPE